MHWPSFTSKEAEIGFVDYLAGLMKKIQGEDEKMEFFQRMLLTVGNMHKNFFQSDEVALSFIRGIEEMLGDTQTSRMMALRTIITAGISLLKKDESKTAFSFSLLERVGRMGDPRAVTVVGALQNAIPEGPDRESFKKKIAEMKSGVITQ